jgi:molybdopterin molybdotransferase
MTPKEKALEIVLAAIPAPSAVETVGLGEALGRVLAADQVADIDMPPFDRSAMDGFALRAADLADCPVELAVLETVKAGDVPTRRIGPGAATRIMTGAPVPAGADAVVMVEWTKPAGEGRVRVERPVSAGANISPKACDLERGETVVRAGQPIRAIEVGVLAALGCTRVPVYARPSVGVVATGDELIPPGAGVPAGGQIRESNGFMLCAQAQGLGWGIDVEFLGIAKDTRESVRAHLERGFAKDVLILSGGVSMGDFDFVHAELAARGLEVLLEKVAIKPGKPLLFGRIRRPGAADGFVFGLPGNPMSSLVTFELFVRPFLRGMMGLPGPHTLEMPARLAAAADAKAMPRTQHLPARLERRDGELVATPVPWHGSGDLRGMLDANGFVIVPAGEAPAPAGAIVTVVALEPDAFRSAPGVSRRGA